MEAKHSKKRIDPRELRRSLDISQQEFWATVGTTQSGGSRYEAGRHIPQPVAMLLDAIYIKGVDLNQIEARDITVLNFLKSQHPDLYNSLDKAAGGKGRNAQK